MKKTYLIIVVCAAVLSLAGLLLHFNSRKPDEPPAQRPEESVVKKRKRRPPECVTLAPGKIGKPTEYVPAEIIPSSFSGFRDASRMNQADIATDAMRRSDLDASEVAFIKAELYNKTLSELTRNNLANALLNRSESDPALVEVFIGMVDDPTESFKWRDYALQFVSVAMTRGGDVEAGLEKLNEVAQHGKGDVQGTAIVGLLFHKQWKTATLVENFSEILERELEAEDTSAATRMTILAAIGKHGDKAQLPIVRKYATQDVDPLLKRAAIASLGAMGDVSDLPLVKSATTHRNKGVQLAAQGAVKRLEKQISNGI